MGWALRETHHLDARRAAVICVPDKSCGDFHGFVTNWMPKDAAANAKAIVWGFIAGFSERFVPNILNRLATDKEK